MLARRLHLLSQDSFQRFDQPNDKRQTTNDKRQTTPCKTCTSPLLHSLLHPPTYPLTPSFTPSPTHSFTRFTHSLAQFGVRGVDSLIVSHDHADAVFGMDDLRSVQYFRRGVDKATGRSLLDILRPIDTYCSDETMAQLKGLKRRLVTRRRLAQT